MASKNTFRILIWIIVILVATNLSMGISVWYHKQQDKEAVEQKEQQIEMPSEQRTRFFRDQLNLNPEQIDVFRDLNRDFNWSAHQISDRMEMLRIQMVEEMGKAEPSQEVLNSITEKIGNEHSALKKLTIAYYLGMKNACNEQQEEKLKQIFLEVSKSKEDIALPQRGSGRGNRGRIGEKSD